METHGLGLSLHVRLGESACDFNSFCSAGLFPAEVFGGPRRWTDEEASWFPQDCYNSFTSYTLLALSLHLLTCTMVSCRLRSQVAQSSPIRIPNKLAM